MQYQELACDRSGEPSTGIRQRVELARRCQLERFSGEEIFSNARMQMRHVRQHCRLERDAQTLLKQALDSLGLSARAYDKILKVARTIADLEECEQVRTHHVSEAVNYRTLDRTLE